MYKVTIFESDNDTVMLEAFAENAEHIANENGLLVVHDVDDEYLAVPVATIGHVSVIKWNL